VIEKIFGSINEGKIRWIDLVFMDIKGHIHSVTVPVSHFSDDVFIDGLTKLDGSSVEGFKDIHKSDLTLIPIPETFVELPFKPSEAGWIICKVSDSISKERLLLDPRYIAENCWNELNKKGLTAFVGSEVEFFIFEDVKVDIDPLGYRQSIMIKSAEEPYRNNGYMYMPNSSYYTSPPIDRYYSLRREAADILKEYFRVEIDALHHEVASSGQIEMDIRYDEVIASGDNLLAFKYVIRRLAEKYNYYPTFMPKPIVSQNGSGLHIHQSLWRDNTNLFYDENDKYANLSQLARYYIGGLIEHGRSLSAIVSPTVNSYKRLVPGFEAPVYLTWSRANRSAAIRIPISHNYSAKRIEYRPPDPSCNPYIAFSAIIAAGLDGIRRKIDPGDPIDKNIYKLTAKEKREYGIKELPRSLWEALEELEIDNDYLRPSFSNQFIERYIEIKKNEYRKLSLHPSPIEYLYYYNL